MYQQYQQFLVNVLQLNVLDMMFQKAKLNMKDNFEKTTFCFFEIPKLGAFSFG